LILNRPFQSVAELGYVSRGTAWKNLNFSFPESGDSALLDVFCVSEPTRTDALVAGRVNLNTRQIPVLQALFSGTNVDVTSPTSTIDPTAAQQLATALFTRTSGTLPIASRAELVGTWTTPTKTVSNTDVNPDDYCTGFSHDIGTISEWKGYPQAFITRQREAAIRALADVGTARTWNLLIDVVAQTGRFTANAGTLDKFLVDGEKRYWLHVAIDRTNGAIIDQQLEPVNE
jgi:hypothetical protein